MPSYCQNSIQVSTAGLLLLFLLLFLLFLCRLLLQRDLLRLYLFLHLAAWLLFSIVALFLLLVVHHWQFGLFLDVAQDQVDYRMEQVLNIFPCLR